MICSILSTVVYCVGLRAATTSCTSRTVDGPRLHRTVRISSSASVGRGSESIYEEHTTMIFVCQAGNAGPLETEAPAQFKVVLARIDVVRPPERIAGVEQIARVGDVHGVGGECPAFAELLSEREVESRVRRQVRGAVAVE